METSNIVLLKSSDVFVIIKVTNFLFIANPFQTPLSSKKYVRKGNMSMKNNSYKASFWFWFFFSFHLAYACFHLYC